MSFNFEVYQNDKLIFQSSSHWLHPIFEFETYLESNSIDRASLIVRDKIIGRAAALLLIRLGIKDIHAGTLSVSGQKVLSLFKVKSGYDLLVEQIGCKTEVLLKEQDDPEKAYLLIKERIAANSFTAI